MSKSESDDGPAEVEDPEQLIQRRRLNSVLDARERVEDIVRRIRPMVNAGEVRESDVNQYIADAVAAYVREMSNPLKEEGEAYWEEREIGEIEIDPPDTASIAWELLEDNKPAYWSAGPNKNGDLPPGFQVINEESLDTQMLNIEGLREFMQLADRAPLSVSRTVEFRTRSSGRRSYTASVTTEIPRHISMRAYELANEFANEIGVDTKGKDVIEGDHGFDYSDILETGPPGGEPPDIDNGDFEFGGNHDE